MTQNNELNKDCKSNRKPHHDPIKGPKGGEWVAPSFDVDLILAGLDRAGDGVNPDTLDIDPIPILRKIDAINQALDMTIEGLRNYLFLTDPDQYLDHQLKTLLGDMLDDLYDDLDSP